MFLKETALYVIPVSIYLIGAYTLYMLIPKPMGHYDVDSYGYDSIALYFAQTGVMTDPHHTNSPPVQPVGYPFFLGVLIWLFGYRLSAIIITQCMCACLVIVISIYSARIMYGDAVAWSVGLLCAGNLGYLIYAQLLLAEMLLLMVLSLFLQRYICFLTTHQITPLVQAGLLLGVSMLIKPVALLFIVPLVCITGKVTYNRFPIHCMLSLLIAFGMPVTLYMGRNYICYDHFFFAPMAQLNVYQCLLAKVMSEVEHISEQEVIQTKLTFAAESLADASGWKQAKQYFYIYLVGWPHIFARIWFINVAKTWLGLYVTQLKKMLDPHMSPVHSFFNQQGSVLERMWAYIMQGTQRPWICVLSCYELCYTALRFLTACIGLCVLYTRRQFVQIALYVSIMVSFSITTGMDGCCRYRLTYEPVLLLLASIGVVYIISCCRQDIKECRYGIT